MNIRRFEISVRASVIFWNAWSQTVYDINASDDEQSKKVWCAAWRFSSGILTLVLRKASCGYERLISYERHERHDQHFWSTWIKHCFVVWLICKMFKHVLPEVHILKMTPGTVTVWIWVLLFHLLNYNLLANKLLIFLSKGQEGSLSPLWLFYSLWPTHAESEARSTWSQNRLSVSERRMTVMLCLYHCGWITAPGGHCVVCVCEPCDNWGGHCSQWDVMISFSLW